MDRQYETFSVIQLRSLFDRLVNNQDGITNKIDIILNTNKAEFILYECCFCSAVRYEININLSFYLCFNYKLDLDYMRK